MTELIITQRPLIKDPTQIEKYGQAKEIRQCPEQDENSRRRRSTRNPEARPRVLNDAG